MTVSETSGRRFCAQWTRFFEYDSPICLRLRPIVSASHPLRSQRLEDSLLNKELDEVDMRVKALSSLIENAEALIEARPEYAAFIIATKLLSRGHHEKYVGSLEADFRELLLPNEKSEKYSQKRISPYFVSGGSIDLTNFAPPYEYQCIFSLQAGLNPSTILGFKKFTFDELPNDIKEKFS